MNLSLSELLDLNRLYLRSNHIFVDELWLTECLKYLLTSHTKKFEEIRTKVIEQWLLNDLSLTGTSLGRLPHNLKGDNTSELELKHVYTLQIKFISNFDHFYGYEYKKKTKRSKKEINRAGHHDLENRNLLLHMTDGVQEIFGRVLEPIKDLWINTVPGCKMHIKGPLNFHKYNDLRFLILNDDNCELLGGEVDTLMNASYDHTVNQLNLLKIQSPDSAVTATDRHNGYVGRTSEQPAAKNKRRESNNTSVEPDNKRSEMEAGNNSPDSAVTATGPRTIGIVNLIGEEPAVDNNYGAANSRPDSAVSATDRHNGYAGRTSEQPVAKNMRRKSNNTSVETDNKRIKMEAGNNSPDSAVSATDRHNGYVGRSSEQPAAKNMRRKSNNTSVETDNKRIKMEAGLIDLTRNDYVSGGSRRPRKSAANDVIIIEL